MLNSYSVRVFFALILLTQNAWADYPNYEFTAGDERTTFLAVSSDTSAKTASRMAAQLESFHITKDKSFIVLAAGVISLQRVSDGMKGGRDHGLRTLQLYLNNTPKNASLARLLVAARCNITSYHSKDNSLLYSNTEKEYSHAYHIDKVMVINDGDEGTVEQAEYEVRFE